MHCKSISYHVTMFHEVLNLRMGVFMHGKSEWYHVSMFEDGFDSRMFFMHGKSI